MVKKNYAVGAARCIELVKTSITSLRLIFLSGARRYLGGESDKFEKRAFRIVYRNFEFHAGVGNKKTHTDIGDGFGMARSLDTLSLWEILRRIHSPGYAALDLGCGDGVVLRLLRLVGFSPVFGVESYPSLAELSARNEPASTIILDSFISSSFSELMLGINKKLLIYAFNPAPPSDIIKALERLSALNPLVLVRNPIHVQDILEAPDFTCTVIEREGNYCLFQIETHGKSA